MLGATAFGNLLASDEVVEAFATRAGRLHKGCCELAWKASHKLWEKPHELDERAGAAAVVAAEELPTMRGLNDCYRLAESRRELLDGGAWLFHGRTVLFQAPGNPYPPSR
jgi:hypothetical protein